MVRVVPDPVFWEARNRDSDGISDEEIERLISYKPAPSEPIAREINYSKEIHPGKKKRHGKF
ncbi:hypothetical protein J4402_01660 [Candidatus Pacearchaeota archaeon]|nr:hypothetical protein [Candidatus Pacearchaeota archaeon]